ncbi:hypothetical protein [Iningainema tapete]|uniref:Uncharacterized protein n=1 Tax=Iningainema tapete BLCC-T55 TaxID=2748662 RepID=A0A8J6XGR6_9CYAN|nr:hypothetical protein [Iningainema tapete]MBD2773978.1 hypothetical protein [Iningainema tapete BLCC-T55]
MKTAISLAFILTCATAAIAQSTADTTAPVETFTAPNNAGATGGSQRSLLLSVTVDSPEFLKVKEGQQIKEGDTISDNSVERDRLLRHRKGITLQVDNLKAKPIPVPSPPSKMPAVKPIPKANYDEEEAAIAQAQMKLTQAQVLLEARTPFLNADNPERRADAEKAESVLQGATTKVEEQQQLLQTMKDMQLQVEIIRHEEAKLKQLEGEQEQAKSALERERARLNASAIEQQQQLQQLKVNVRMAQSELELSKSRLSNQKTRRQMEEYKASAEVAQRAQKEQELNQEYNKQQLSYAQAVRDRDYQLAQLSLSLASVDEKLSQIPVVRAPRNGYIRRIKPWIGNNGKYTTTLTISSSTPDIKSHSGK